jgi:CheY-like chemotaxis protein
LGATEERDWAAPSGEGFIRFEAGGGDRMTAPLAGLPLLPSIPPILHKKRVLLVDISPASRDLRAEVMRKRGMEVDCAADIGEARSWWRAGLYNLVLIHMEIGTGQRDKFCEDVRGAAPPQQLAFLVGKPEYLADSPNTVEEGSVQNVPHAFRDEVEAIRSTGAFRQAPLRWGILEASRRISAVRSASVARTRAMRETPTPPRDLETRDSKRRSAWSQVLPELQKEEIE